MKIKGDRQEQRMVDKILDAIERIGGGCATITDYENGRENGYVITDSETGQSATFREQR